MILNRAAHTAAGTNFRALYTRGFNAPVPLHRRFSIEIMSTGSRETFLIPGAPPAVREWIGARQAKNLRTYEETLRNRKWELTVTIPREAFEDDELGMFAPQIELIGTQMALHPDVLFAELLENGFADVCYDGVAFFSAAHPVDAGAVQSNLGTQALDSAAFEAAVTAIGSLKDNNGNPIDVFSMGGELELIVPQSLESTARGILLAQQGANGATNTNFGRAKVTVNRRLTSAIKWYLGIAGGPVRPMISQMRRRPNLVSKTSVTDDNVFELDEFVFGADGRWTAGYGMWQLMYGSTGVD